MDLILLQPGNTEIQGTGLISGTLDGFATNEMGENCIECVSCNFGMKQQMTTDVSNSARTSGRPDVQDITLIKYVDQSSPKLYQHCLGATPIGKDDALTKIYICRNSDNKIANILTLELKDAMVSSIAMQSHPNDMATEQLTLNFTQVTWTATVQLNNTSAGGVVAATWSVATDRPIPPP